VSQPVVASMANKKEKLIGAVNGAFGNRLADHDNPLACDMTLYFLGHALATVSDIDDNLDAQLSLLLNASPTKTVAIFIHGLGNTEHIWDFAENTHNKTGNIPNHQPAHNAFYSHLADNYGKRIMQKRAITPLFLRYNTGLNIAENGALLDKLLTQLYARHTKNIDQVILVGFSMGGLVARAAQGAARAHGDASWADALKHAFYIGTPHEGAPLERFADAASSLISRAPRPYFSIWGDQINLRSKGVKDLGTTHSSLEHFDFHPQCQHYFVAGSLWPSDKKIANWLLGDSLVRKSSAHPADRPEESEVSFFAGIHHIELAHSNKVWKQLNYWLSKHFPPEDLGDHVNFEALQQSVLTPEESSLVKGAIISLTKASEHIINLTESVHKSIAKEPFSLLNQTPVVGKFSRPVQGIHNTCSAIVYWGLRGATRQLKQMSAGPLEDTKKSKISL